MDALEIAEVPGTAAQHMQPVGIFSLRDRIRCAGRGGCGDEVAVVRHGVLMQYRQIFIQSWYWQGGILLSDADAAADISCRDMVWY